MRKSLYYARNESPRCVGAWMPLVAATTVRSAKRSASCFLELGYRDDVPVVGVEKMAKLFPVCQKLLPKTDGKNMTKKKRKEVPNDLKNI